MEVKINKLPKSQIELKIEVPTEEFNHFINQAILNLGKGIEIKGFRKGKAPKEILEEEIGPEKILIEAADLAIKENYRKVILENKIEAIAQPEIDILKLPRPTSPLPARQPAQSYAVAGGQAKSGGAQSKAGGTPGNPFVFQAKISVLPEVKLPDYKKIAEKIKRKKISVEEKEVNDALKWIQKSRAKFTLKNGPAQKGDFVEIEYWSSQINELDQSKGQKDAFILGEGHFIPGFEEQLIGIKAGPSFAPDGATAGKEEKEFSLTIPEKHPLKKYGREITFKVKMNSVQNVEFPEINDQFAKSLGQFENLTALKKSIKEGLHLEKEQIESRRIRNEILEKISQATECEIPEILIEKEQKAMMENFKRNVSEKLNIPLKDYLTKIKKTEQEIFDSFLREAQKRVKNFLILRKIKEKEGIKLSEEEIEKETNKILKQYSNLEKVKKNFASQNLGGLDRQKLKEYNEEVIMTEKIFQLLENLTRL